METQPCVYWFIFLCALLRTLHEKLYTSLQYQQKNLLTCALTLLSPLYVVSLTHLLQLLLQGMESDSIVTPEYYHTEIHLYWNGVFIIAAFAGYYNAITLKYCAIILCAVVLESEYLI